MAGIVATRDWEALEMADMIAQHGQITVTGEVELSDTGSTAELKEHVPPSTDPKILLLDLVIHRHGGIQGHIARFDKLTFRKKLSGDAYGEVDVLYGGEIVQRVKVERPLTFAAPRVTPPAKKAVTEKKPPRAAAAKKRTAKKAAKKPTMKATKKSTKKSVRAARKKSR